MYKWNGAFLPVKKHRDYGHAGFFEHEMDNGGSYEVAEDTPLEAERNPVDMKLFNGTRTHYAVRINLHDNSTYDYFVPADDNGYYPNREEIKASVDQQNNTPLPQGVKRDPIDILSEDSYADYLEIENEDSAWNRHQV